MTPVAPRLAPRAMSAVLAAAALAALAPPAEAASGFGFQGSCPGRGLCAANVPGTRGSCDGGHVDLAGTCATACRLSLAGCRL